MAAMKIDFYSEQDAIHIQVNEGQFSHAETLDDRRHLGYGPEGELLWVSLLNVSQGVDMDMFTGEQNRKQLEEVSKELEKHHIRMSA